MLVKIFRISIVTGSKVVPSDESLTSNVHIGLYSASDRFVWCCLLHCITVVVFITLYKAALTFESVGIISCKV